jgi:hypothetical protein
MGQGMWQLAAALCTVLALSRLGAAFSPNAPPALPVKTDIKFIRCQVCEALAKNAHRQAKSLRDAVKPGKKVSEMALLEVVESLANPVKEQGEWINKIDLVEEGSKLSLVEQDQVGECNSECKTVAKAAEEIIGEHDTDLAEELWKGNKNRAQLTKWLCYELTNSCKTKPPPLPKDRKPGPTFKEMDEKDLQMQRLMANMKESGLGGTMYDRDTIMKKYMSGYDDDYEMDEESSPDNNEGGISDTVSKVKDMAGAAAEKAREGVSSIVNSAKGLFGGKQADSEL